jgi:tetratricopeptide (TPR) repeat protein
MDGGCLIVSQQRFSKPILALSLSLACFVSAFNVNALAWDLGLHSKSEAESAKQASSEKNQKQEELKAEEQKKQEAQKALQENDKELAPKTPEEHYERGLDLFKIAQNQSEKGNLNGQRTLLKEAITEFTQAVTLSMPKTDTAKNDSKSSKESSAKDTSDKPKLTPRAAMPKVAIEAESNIGFAYLTLKNYKEAIKAFEQTLKWNPNHLNTLNGLGTTYTFDKKEDLALQTFEKLVSLDPGNPQYFFNQGSVLQKFERYDEAKTAYEKALALAPQDQRTLFNLATLLDNQGAWAEARPYYVKAKEIAIESPIGLEAFHRIQVIDAQLKAKETEKVSSKKENDTAEPAKGMQPQEDTAH